MITTSITSAIIAITIITSFIITAAAAIVVTMYIITIIEFLPKARLHNVPPAASTGSSPPLCSRANDPRDV